MEKWCIGSFFFGIIFEICSLSFSGSIDFFKVFSKSWLSFDVDLIYVLFMDNLNELCGSLKSLVEVKILSDKIIVFWFGVEKKLWVLSVDSVNVSGLRWDRLLVNSS